MTDELLKVAALSAVSVWGVTQAIKPAIKKWATSAWSKSAVRLACLALGAVWGVTLQPDTTGAVTGICGAALSSIIVGVIKGRINDTNRIH